MRRIQCPEITKRLGIARTEERDGLLLLWTLNGGCVVIDQDPVRGGFKATYYTPDEANRYLAQGRVG